MTYSCQKQAGLTRYLGHGQTATMPNVSTEAPLGPSLLLKQSSHCSQGWYLGQLSSNSPQAWGKAQNPICLAFRTWLLIPQQGWLFLRILPWLRTWMLLQNLVVVATKQKKPPESIAQTFPVPVPGGQKSKSSPLWAQALPSQKWAQLILDVTEPIQRTFSASLDSPGAPGSFNYPS